MSESEAYVMCEKLKQCPFCGGEVTERWRSLDDGTGRKLLYFECEKCHAQSGEYYSTARDTLVGWWNKRAEYYDCYALKYCPFCGHRGLYLESKHQVPPYTGEGVRAYCILCRSHTDWYADVEGAIEAWNARYRELSDGAAKAEDEHQKGVTNAESTTKFLGNLESSDGAGGVADNVSSAGLSSAARRSSAADLTRDTRDDECGAR